MKRDCANNYCVCGAQATYMVRDIVSLGKLSIDHIHTGR